jgi:hypothetical protein
MMKGDTMPQAPNRGVVYPQPFHSGLYRILDLRREAGECGQQTLLNAFGGKSSQSLDGTPRRAIDE